MLYTTESEIPDGCRNGERIAQKALYDEYKSRMYTLAYPSESGKLELYHNAITLTTGIQSTFSDHLYFDVEIGGAVDLRRGEGISLFGDVQVGIKF